MSLHRFSLLVASVTFAMVVVGSLVTSTGAGLAIPEWPATFGASASGPGVLLAQAHRVLGVLVGLLVFVLAAWVWRSQAAGWMRGLAILALAAVVLQGLLGGLAVLVRLPVPISVAHASLAHLVFALTVAVAVFTSPGWQRGYSARGGDATGRPAEERTADAWLLALTGAALPLVYLQMLVGAWVRHTGAALAIPDYPLAFGGLLPPLDRLASFPVAIQFAHRLGALAVAGALAVTLWLVWTRYRDRPELQRPAVLLAALVAVKIVLGGLIVMLDGPAAFSAAHASAGALLLGMTLVLALGARRPLVRPAMVPATRKSTRP